jgi:hypothetical protein
MVAHLILTLTLMISRNENVRACLPLDHSKADFERKDVELATGLGVAIGLLVVEFIGLYQYAQSAHAIIRFGTHATSRSNVSIYILI